MKKLILIGDSGHAKVIEHVALRDGWTTVAKLDDKYSKISFDKNGQIKGPVSLAREILDEETFVLIAIGANRVRNLIFDKLQLPLEKYATIIDPSAIIAKDVLIGFGTCIMPNSIVNPASEIGNHVILNTRCVIEHDNIIEDYVHISPGSVLTGNVRVEKGCHIGAGATLIPNINIGSWTIVGAGSTVIRNIEDNVTVVGTPSRTLDKTIGGV